MSLLAFVPVDLLSVKLMPNCTVADSDRSWSELCMGA